MCNLEFFTFTVRKTSETKVVRKKNSSKSLVRDKRETGGNSAAASLKAGGILCVKWSKNIGVLEKNARQISDFSEFFCSKHQFLIYFAKYPPCWRMTPTTMFTGIWTHQRRSFFTAWSQTSSRSRCQKTRTSGKTRPTPTGCQRLKITLSFVKLIT